MFTQKLWRKQANSVAVIFFPLQLGPACRSKFFFLARRFSLNLHVTEKAPHNGGSSYWLALLHTVRHNSLCESANVEILSTCQNESRFLIPSIWHDFYCAKKSKRTNINNFCYCIACINVKQSEFFCGQASVFCRNRNMFLNEFVLHFLLFEEWWQLTITAINSTKSVRSFFSLTSRLSHFNWTEVRSWLLQPGLCLPVFCAAQRAG